MVGEDNKLVCRGDEVEPLEMEPLAISVPVEDAMRAIGMDELQNSELEVN